ncbi:MAG TPA: signal peptidase I [Blastocatellia bacterium]|nr:signal peptidase I [Blastocatellia bacterium]
MTRQPEIVEPRQNRESSTGASAPAQATIPGPPKSLFREYFEQLVVTFIMALFLMTFIAQAVQVPTGSMQNTINIGDQLFVNKFIFGRNTPVIGSLLPAREIRRGDIIVFKLPSDPKVNYVKRVIGLPGDEVRVQRTDVLINNKLLPEQHVTVKLAGHDRGAALPIVRTDPAPEGARWRVYYDDEKDEDGTGDIHIAPGMKFAVREPFRVPEGEYFVMGDSRDNSLDSRFWGTVPRNNIIARALYVHWSFIPRDSDNPSSGGNLFSRINWGRLGSAVK